MLRRLMNKLLNEQKFFRRIILLWSMCMITFWSMFLMDKHLLINIGPSGAAVISTIFAILTSVIAFYQWHRKLDDEAAMKEKINEENNSGDTE